MPSCVGGPILSDSVLFYSFSQVNDFPERLPSLTTESSHLDDRELGSLEPSHSMVCPFGFVAAAVVFGPRALTRVRELPVWQQVAVVGSVILAAGWITNQLMFMWAARV